MKTIPERLNQMTGGIDAHDLAKVLGVSLASIYKQAATGGYPSYHVGTSLRFDPAVIANLLEVPVCDPARGPC
jgi:hypothetical protein